MITKTSAEAQNRFGELLDTAQREPVAITRHGRPAVCMIPFKEAEAYQAWRSEQRTRLAKEWAEWSELAHKRAKPEAQSLTEEDIVRLVHELRRCAW